MKSIWLQVVALLITVFALFLLFFSNTFSEFETVEWLGFICCMVSLVGNTIIIKQKKRKFG